MVRFFRRSFIAAVSIAPPFPFFHFWHSPCNIFCVAAAITEF
jgi:hypothetical protein